MSLRKLILPSLLACSFMGTLSAMAAPVTFVTAYDFGGGAVSTALNGGTFTLLGTAGVNQATPANDVDFGTITYTGIAPGSASTTTTFDFGVAQTSPTGGTGTSFGNEFQISVNKKGALAEIDVTGGSVTIGAYTYTLQDQQFILGNGGSDTILGNISVNAVPVPAAAWGGVSLLGLLGGGRLWKRRRELA